LPPHLKYVLISIVIFFYIFVFVENLSDERSILFEKQRLRLRRAIQTVTTGTVGSSAVKPSKNGESSATAGASVKVDISGTSAAADFHTPRGKEKPMAQRGTGTGTRARMSPTKNATRTPAYSHPKSPGSVASASSQPIYAWELSAHQMGEAISAIRERITTETASFIPSNDMGVYVCDSMESNNADSNDLVDFQVVLSAEEFQVYVSRRRNAVAEKKHSERFIDTKKTTEEKKSLLSSGPYVDPKRIQNELLRPAQPHKWVGDGGGFRPTGSKIQ
jgi:hypothetical protein